MVQKKTTEVKAVLEIVFCRLKLSFYLAITVERDEAYIDL